MNGEANVADGDQRIERDLAGLFIEGDLHACDADFPEDGHGFEGPRAAQIGAADDAAALHLEITLDNFGPGEPVFAVADAAAVLFEFAGGHVQELRGHSFALCDRFAASLHYGAAHQRGGSAGAGGAFEKSDAGIGADEAHFFEWDAHLFRGDLREHGVAALADLRAAA